MVHQLQSFVYQNAVATFARRWTMHFLTYFLQDDYALFIGLPNIFRRKYLSSSQTANSGTATRGSLGTQLTNVTTKLSPALRSSWSDPFQASFTLCPSLTSLARYSTRVFAVISIVLKAIWSFTKRNLPSTRSISSRTRSSSRSTERISSSLLIACRPIHSKSCWDHNQPLTTTIKE
jgi:hypothetical protein